MKFNNYDPARESRIKRFLSILDKSCGRTLSFRSVFCLLAIQVLAINVSIGVSRADTFEQALANQLANNCQVLRQNQIATANPEILKIGPNLANVCGFMCTSDGMGGVAGCVLGAGTDGGTGGTASQQTTVAPILKRLRALREGEEENSQQSAKLPAEEASTDGVFNIAPGVNAFLSLEYENREKKNTAFEDGYDSDLVNITLGGDYRLTNWAVLGLAFNYSNLSGDFDEGGDFDTDSLGAFLYGSFTPIENAFVEVVLNYARKAFDRTRQASFSRTLGVGPGATVQTFGGPVSADFNGNEVGASAATGYDVALGQFTIGPRAGLNWTVTQRQSYEETGGTGLEMRFREDTRVSLQSSVGAQASMAIGTGFGVLVPQLSLAWIHEFADDQRDIEVSFAEDDRTAPVQFSFSTEEPDRDYAEINVGVSAVLPGGISTFANFRTLLGNTRFDIYGGSVGVRLEL